MTSRIENRQQSLNSLFWITLIAGAPLWCMTALYIVMMIVEAPEHHFRGDSDIGIGIVLMVGMWNLPVLLIAWLGWAVWTGLSSLRHR